MARLMLLAVGVTVLAIIGLFSSSTYLCNVPSGWGDRLSFQELDAPSKVSTSLPPLGSMGPNGSGREHYRYYDTLYFIMKQFESDTKSVLEVGCTKDPFIKHVDWANERLCVAPYSAYGKTALGHAVNTTKADFVKWKAPKVYDLVVCSQVAEHVQNPKEFVRKLVRTAKIAVISVPFMWPPSAKSHHVTNYINLEMMENWTLPQKPIMSTIVQEDQDTHGRLRRLIVVYKSLK